MKKSRWIAARNHATLIARLNAKLNARLNAPKPQQQQQTQKPAKLTWERKHDEV